MGIVENYVNVLKHCVDFDGRTRRQYTQPTRDSSA
jgi:hypothetical protein